MNGVLKRREALRIHVQRKDYVRGHTQTYMGRERETNKMGLTRNQPCRHLIHGIPAAVKKNFHCTT
jgi:hypothetical protein